jgi:hypothetical protein
MIFKDLQAMIKLRTHKSFVVVMIFTLQYTIKQTITDTKHNYSSNEYLEHAVAYNSGKKLKISRSFRHVHIFRTE